MVLNYQQHKFIPSSSFGDTEYFMVDVSKVSDANPPEPKSLSNGSNGNWPRTMSAQRAFQKQRNNANPHTERSHGYLLEASCEKHNNAPLL